MSMSQILSGIQLNQVSRILSGRPTSFLEEGMETRSSILAWRIPWLEDPGGLQPTGGKALDTTEQLSLFFVFFFF